jgi:hypothetical protein
MIYAKARWEKRGEERAKGAEGGHNADKQSQHTTEVGIVFAV